MSAAETFRLKQSQFDLLGSVAIRILFGLLIFITVYLVWALEDLVIVVPLVFAGGTAAWFLFRRPLLNLASVLALFVLIVDFEEGLQTTEIFYGLYYLAFLGHWYGRKLVIERTPIVTSRSERRLVLFLVLMTLSLFLTLLFNGSLSQARGEWLSLSFLAFYFPIRDAIKNEPRGLMVMIGIVLWLGLFVLVRNVLNYQELLLNASYAYQITRGRAVTNTALIIVPCIFAVLFFVGTRRWIIQLPAAALFLLFAGGLILTQSRGYWVAFIAGMVVLAVLAPNRMRFRLLSFGLFSSALILGLAVLFLGDFVLLVLSGLLDRFLSIGSAATTDISLVNRFLESSAVLDKIRLNPILGYGMGVPFSVYDITFEITLTKSFVHNGYVALWYKFGIWGPVLLFWFLASVLRRCFLVLHDRMTSDTEKTSGYAVIVCFAAFSISALTSNPFYLNDTMIMFAILAGIGGGLYARLEVRQIGREQFRG